MLSLENCADDFIISFQRHEILQAENTYLLLLILACDLLTSDRAQSCRRVQMFQRNM
jgi:hypothetical protein